MQILSKNMSEVWVMECGVIRSGHFRVVVVQRPTQK